MKERNQWECIPRVELDTSSYPNEQIVNDIVIIMIEGERDEGAIQELNSSLFYVPTSKFDFLFFNAITRLF